MITSVKNYTITKALGKEGIFFLYQAVDQNINKKIFLKVIDLKELENIQIDQFIKKIEIEIKKIVKLDHPNIQNIYDFGKENDLYFIVYELFEGKPLSTVINKVKRLPLNEILILSLKLCSALSYANKQGITHKDIKPANIFISTDNLKISNFSIGYVADSEENNISTIPYSPPEQIVGKSKLDQRSDIYSLGITLFQIFTGNLPYEGNSAAETINKILNQEISSMKSYRENIPEALERIIFKAIKRNADERYQSIEDLESALIDIKEYIKVTGKEYNLTEYSARNKSLDSVVSNNEIPEKTRKKSGLYLFIVLFIFAIFILIKIIN